MERAEFEPGLIGGAEKIEIRLAEYAPDWPVKFAVHCSRLGNALGTTALEIEHIGSTSVPGLAAKAIIDILVVVNDSSNEAVYLPQLLEAGYVLRVREPGWNEHRMLRTPARDVHVHIYSKDCPEIGRNLLFRDRLRANAKDRHRYEQTKRHLAAQDWRDMNAYARAKSAVIEDIIASAQAAYHAG